MDRNVSLTRVSDRANPFGELSYALASQFLNRATEARLASVRKFMDGDHWQNGKGWVGPHPGQGEAGYSEVMAKISEAFVSYNALKEIVERHMKAVVGKLPVWALTLRRPMKDDEDEPTDEEQALIDEASALLKPWLQSRRVHRHIQAATMNGLWSGRGPLRIYIPSGLLDEVNNEDGTTDLVAKAKNMTEAMDLLFVEAPEPEVATVFIDPSSQLRVGLTSYKPVMARTFLATGVTVYEVCFVEKDGKTVMRRMEPANASEYDFDFGKRLPIYEMLLDPLITDQLVQGQKALNLALSVLPRTIVTAGFVEMVIMNAQMPGYEEVDSKGNKTGRWIMGKFQRGAGTVNWLQGAQVEQPDGKVAQATPSVQFRELPSVEPIIATAQEHYSKMLSEAKQAHILANQAADASGDALKQRRADFTSSLETTTTEVQVGWSWLIETALAFAEAVIGSPGKYTTRLMATTTCRINTGPLSTAERTQNAADVSSGLLSPETAIQMNGIDDVDGELQRIASQQEKTMARVKQQADIMASLTASGVPLEVAAVMVGLDETIIKDLKLVDEQEPAPTEDTQP